MIIRSESELNFVKNRTPIPSVEIDLDSIPDGISGYGNLIFDGLSAFAKKNSKLIATIYVQEGSSVNFGTQTWSAFFGISGSERLLHPLLAAFQRVKGMKARFSDYIKPPYESRQFHIQDGLVWQGYEEGSWFASQPNDLKNADNDTCISITEPDDADAAVSRSDEPTAHEARPARLRIARADASVSTIKTKIELVFGLPAGSVKLFSPDGRAIRGNATIATLRKRWE